MYVTLGLLKRGAGGGGGGGGGGTFPSIVSLTDTFDSGGTYTVNMPATVTSGDLLIMILNRLTSGSSPLDVPPGWALLFDFPTGSRHGGFYKWAVGTEGGTSVSFVDTGSVGIQVIFSVLRIQGADSAQAPQATTEEQPSTSTPNPPALDPTWATANNLFIAYAGAIASRTIVAYPAGYTFYQEERHSPGGTVFIAAKQSSSSASENPGNFTISSAISNYVATIAVKGAP